MSPQPTNDPAVADTPGTCHERERFEQLTREWQSIVEARERRLHKRRTRQSAQWREQFMALQRQAGALMAQGRWVRGPSDLLSVIGRERDELTHSRMLAWLLDPSGNHGLGAALLQRLARRVDIEVLSEEDVGRVRIRREVAHPDGRADLLIELPEFRIVIENKIDAGEAPDQCARVVRAFDTEAAAFVFLTLEGYAPASAGTYADRWTAVSYIEVAAWLEDLSSDFSTGQGHAARSYLATLRRLTA